MRTRGRSICITQAAPSPQQKSVRSSSMSWTISKAPDLPIVFPAPVAAPDRARLSAPELQKPGPPSPPRAATHVRGLEPTFPISRKRTFLRRAARQPAVRCERPESASQNSFSILPLKSRRAVNFERCRNLADRAESRELVRERRLTVEVAGFSPAHPKSRWWRPGWHGEAAGPRFAVE
jgi:hypothetical protein